MLNDLNITLYINYSLILKVHLYIFRKKGRDSRELSLHVHKEVTWAHSDLEDQSPQNKPTLPETGSWTSSLKNTASRTVRNKFLLFKKQKENKECWQGCGQSGILTQCGGNVKWCSYYWKRVWHFLKKLNRVTTWPNKSAPRYILKRTENICLSKNLYTQIFIAELSLISQKLEIIQSPSTDESIKKMVYPYSGILYNHKSNKIPIFATTWLKLWKHYAKWKKPDMKGHIILNWIYMKYSEQQIHKDIE